MNQPDDEAFRALIRDAVPSPVEPVGTIDGDARGTTCSTGGNGAGDSTGGNGSIDGPGRTGGPAAAIWEQFVRTGSWFDDRLARIPDSVRRHARWAAPTAVMAIAAGTRLIGLQRPDAIVFDETYYVKDAWATWNLGYESNWQGSDVNSDWVAGNVNGYTGVAAFAVHPPLGKWIIGFFEWLIGPSNPYSWRFGVAIVGVLLVAAIMLAAWLLTKSVGWSALAGFLLAIDGNAIVMSRVGLLDGMVAFFALVGFVFVLLDRARTQRTGALWWRPWLLAAALALGFDAAVKWNGIWFLAALGVYSVVGDPLARRSVGAFLARTFINLLHLVPLAVIAYMSTWIGWFRSSSGYDRQWAWAPGNAWTGTFAWVPHSIQSWLHFEQAVYAFNVGEHSPHPYASPAWQWLLLIRPTSMYWQSSAAGDPGCTAASCGSSILDIANPLIWWASVAAAIYLLIRLLRYREWQVGAILIALGGGYLPWLAYPDRTIFEFYTISFEPYLILALVLAARVILGSPQDERWRRTRGWWLLIGFNVVAVALCVFYWPLYTGETIPYSYMQAHWWFPSWI